MKKSRPFLAKFRTYLPIRVISTQNAILKQTTPICRNVSRSTQYERAPKVRDCRPLSQLFPIHIVMREMVYRYHWAFILGPKHEKPSTETPGTKFHIKNTQSVDGSWQYEEKVLPDVRNDLNLLARVLVAKVEDEQHLIAVLRSVPIIQDDEHWRCWSWVADAIVALEADGKALGTSVLQWERIQSAGEEFVKKKLDAGRYEKDSSGPRPVFDLLRGREVVP